MRAIRFSDRVVIAAPPDGGKTTLWQYIVSTLQPARTIVIDTKQAPELAHIQPIVHDAGDLPEALRAPVCHWVPEDTENWKELAIGFDHIWRLGMPADPTVKVDTRLTRCIVVNDEAADTSKPNKITPGEAKIIRRGRVFGKLYIAGTQRLSETGVVVRTAAQHIFALTPAPMDLDLDKLAQHLGMNPQDLREAMNSLHEQAGDHSHLWFCAPARELRRMAACPPPPYDWPPRGRPVPRVAPDVPEQVDDPQEAPGETSGASALEEPA